MEYDAARLYILPGFVTILTDLSAPRFSRRDHRQEDHHGDRSD